MSDAQTLRLAHPEITVPRLDDFLAAVSSTGDYDAQVLEARGLKIGDANQIFTAVQAFLGPRRVARRLQRRLDEATLRLEKAATDGTAPPAKELELATTLPGKIDALRHDPSLEALYSQGTLEALAAREEQLLARFGAG